MNEDLESIMYGNLDMILKQCSDHLSNHENSEQNFKDLCMKITGNENFKATPLFKTYIQRLLKDEYIYSEIDSLGKLYYVATIEGMIFISVGGYKRYAENIKEKESLALRQSQSVIDTNELVRKSQKGQRFLNKVALFIAGAAALGSIGQLWIAANKKEGLEIKRENLFDNHFHHHKKYKKHNVIHNTSNDSAKLDNSSN